MGWGGISLPGPGNWTPSPAAPALPPAVVNLANKASDKMDKVTGVDLNAGDNAQNALQHPLSFSSGGLIGGDAGVAQFNSGGAGVKNSSLTGGLSNKNNSYGLLALAAYFGGSYFMGGDTGVGVGAGANTGVGVDADTGIRVGTGAGAASPAPAGGGFNWGAAINTASALYQGSQAGKAAGKASDQADPFASQRPMYQVALKTLMTNPAGYINTPMYQTQLASGVDAVDRSAGAKGMLGSGNRLAALQAYGGGLASQEFFKYADLLSTLSGATSGSPEAAAQATMQGAGAQNQAYSQALSYAIPLMSSYFGWGK